MEMCTAEGHLVGMLDRDQRTAKMFSYHKHVVVVTDHEDSPKDAQQTVTKQNKVISHRTVPGRTSPHSSCKTRKNGHFWKSLHRLKHTLIVGAYLSFLTFPSILSAPTNQTPMSSRREKIPKWTTCEINVVQNSGEPKKTEKELVNQIIKMATIAQSRTQFQREYAKEMFKMNFTDLHNMYKEKNYSWIPKIPKTLGEEVPPEHLETLELSETLLNVYTYLQTIAVGLEQVVWDLEDQNSHFKSKFEDTEYWLRLVLCEIKTVIVVKNLDMPPDVERNVMDEELRQNTDNTFSTLLKSWVIYRDYLNMLEYIIQVFTYFDTKASTIS